MTPDETFGLTLATWLHEEAEHRVPDHLGDVLMRTVSTRQRPWWSSLERWLPVDTSTSLSGRTAARRPLLWVAVLVTLLLAIIGATLFVGALRSPAPTFGLATNGRLFVANGDTLVSYAADGTDPRDEIVLPNGASDLTPSPDGTRLATVVPVGPPRIDIVRFGESSVVSLRAPDGSLGIGSAPSWSPDGRQVVYLSYDGLREHLVIAAADGSSSRVLPLDAIDPRFGLWSPVWSPDGEWIAFEAGDRETYESQIYVVRPDGSDLHALGTSTVGAGSASWAPDPTVQRLLYTAVGNTVKMYDLAADHDQALVAGFWPTWSPDGTKFSFWTNGTEVIPIADAVAGRDTSVHVYPPVNGTCQDHPELAKKAFCGPATWSPDGSRLIAHDIVGTSILSVLADGTGSPIVLPLDPRSTDVAGSAVWQPMR